VRYLLGFIIGLLLMAGIQYKERNKDFDTSIEKRLKTAQVTYYLGCLNGYKIGSKNTGIPEYFLTECRVQSINIEQELRRILK